MSVVRRAAKAGHDGRGLRRSPRDNRYPAGRRWRQEGTCALRARAVKHRDFARKELFIRAAVKPFPEKSDEETIKTVALDDDLPRGLKVDFLKVDVEGYEVEAL